MQNSNALQDQRGTNLYRFNGRYWRLFAHSVTPNGYCRSMPYLKELLYIDIETGQDVFGTDIIILEGSIPYKNYIRGKGEKMKAILKELVGKYYGTQIEITIDDQILDTITIWTDGWHDNVIAVPSPRELVEISPIDWAENKWLPDIIFQETMKKGCYARDYFEICNSHYENCTSYYMALKIVDSFNGTTLARHFKPMYDKLIEKKKT